MSKRNPGQEPLPPANIVISREEIEQLLRSQIDKGKLFLASPIQSEQELQAARDDSIRWSKFNRELLLRWFDNPSLADEYERYYGGVYPMNPTLAQQIQTHRDSVRDKVNRLMSIVERLPLMSVTSTDPFSPTTTAVNQNGSAMKAQVSRKVFVVHGHDEAAKHTVARFLSQLQLDPIILAEQPNAGKTIIEKLETFSDVGFAVVLLTADDVGAAKAHSDKLQPRARQNVILELGYFMSRLGRDRVCALCQAGVERPSDYDGVVYTPLDESGAWKFALAKEIKNAGIDVDMNLA